MISGLLFVIVFLAEIDVERLAGGRADQLRDVVLGVLIAALAAQEVGTPYSSASVTFMRVRLQPLAWLNLRRSTFLLRCLMGSSFSTKIGVSCR